MVTKRILCLANSRKLNGHCISGRELADDGSQHWIRPVGSAIHQGVSDNELRYADGSSPRLLDVIEMSLSEAVPDACQTENWTIDASRRWRLVRRSDWSELQRYVETPAVIWINGHSTHYGLNDQIPVAIADQLPCSLYLIKVDEVVLRVFSTSESLGPSKRKMNARFNYASVRYVCPVTDPVIEQEYLGRQNDQYTLGPCCLTLSLAEPLMQSNGQSFRSKLVAAIIERDRC